MAEALLDEFPDPVPKQLEQEPAQQTETGIAEIEVRKRDLTETESMETTLESLFTLLPSNIPGATQMDKLKSFIELSKLKPLSPKEDKRPRSAPRLGVTRIPSRTSSPSPTGGEKKRLPPTPQQKPLNSELGLEGEKKVLREQDDRLQTECRQLKDQLRGKTAKFKEDTDKLRKEIKTLESKSGKLETDLKGKQADVVKLRSERDKFSREIESMKKDRENRVETMLKQEARIKVLESQKQPADKSPGPVSAAPEPLSPPVKPTQRKSINEMEIKMKHLKEQVNTSQDSVAIEKLAREKLEAERKGFFAEKREFESKVTSLERQLKEKEDELRVRGGREETLEIELKSSKQKLKELALNDGSKLKIRLVELQGQNEKLREEAAKSRQTLEQQEREYKAVVKRKDTLLSSRLTELNEFRTHRDRLSAEKLAAQKSLEEEEKKNRIILEKKQELVEEIERKLTGAVEKGNALTLETEALNRALLSTRREMETVTRENESLWKRVNDSESQYGHLQTERDVFDSHIEEMVQKVSLAEASKDKLTSDLKQRTQQSRRFESQLAKKLQELSSTEEKLKTIKLALAIEQKKVQHLHSDLLALKERREMGVLEQLQLEENRELLKRLQSRAESLQEQLHFEQLERVKNQERERDLRHQVQSLSEEKEETSSLLARKEEKMKKMDIKLSTQREKMVTMKERVKYSEEASRGYEERALVSEQNTKVLQDLLTEKEAGMEADLKKAHLDRRKSQEKLNSSREKHSRKRQSLEADNASLQESLHQLQLQQGQQLDWSGSLQSSCKALQQERTLLATRIANLEEDVKDLKWKLLKEETLVDHLRKEKQLLERQQRKYFLDISSPTESPLPVLSASLDSGMSSLFLKDFTAT